MLHRTTIYIITYCVSSLLSVPLLWAQPFANVKDPVELQRLASTTTNDSIRATAWARLSFLYIRNKPDSAIYYARHAISVATPLKMYDAAGSAHLYLGVVHRRTGNMDSALWYNLRAYELGQQANDLRLQSMAQGNIGLIYKAKNEFERAIEALLASERISEILKDTANAATTNINIAATYADQLNNLDSAEAILRRNLVLLENNAHFNPSLPLAISYLALGMGSKRHNEFSVSIGWLLKSLQMFRALGDKAGSTEVYHTLIEAYIDKGSLDQAMKYCETAIATATELQYQEGIFDNMLYKAQILRLDKQAAAALSTLDAIAQSIEDSQQSRFQLRLYREYARVHKSLHHRKIAKYYEQKYIALKAESDAAAAKVNGMLPNAAPTSPRK